MQRDESQAASYCRLRVRPRHCDAQGIMHASRYYEYIEDAFLEWLDEHVGGYASIRSAGFDLMVVASGCEHRQGPCLDDLLEVEVRPLATGRTSLTMSFTFRHDGETLAEGHTTYVSVSGGAAAPLPDAIRAAVAR